MLGFVKKPLHWALLFAGLTVVWCSCAAGAETNRLRVAVLEPECLGDTNLQWGTLVRDAISAQLSRYTGISICPETSVAWALRAISDSTNGSPQGRAQSIGQIVGAERVVTVRYGRDRGEWELALGVLTTASGEISKSFEERSTNWTLLIPSISSRLAHYLGAAPTNRVASILDVPEPAFELISSAFALSENHGSIAEMKAKVERAVEIAPASAFLHRTLAHSLVASDDLIAAHTEAKKALALDPESAGSLSTLGEVYLCEGMWHLAREQFEKAVSIDPDDSDSFLRLGQIFERDGLWEKATKAFQTAAEIEPFNSRVHARLAETYNVLGRTEVARDHLRKAQACDDGVECENARLIASASSQLGDLPVAADYCRRYISCAKQVGIPTPYISETVSNLSAIQARIAVHFLDLPTNWPTNDVSKAPPKTLKLEGATTLIVTNPLACSAEMAEWAKKATQDGTNNLQKARLLYTAVVRPVSRRPQTTNVTAEGVFAELFRPMPRLNCHSFTLLYIALARSIGLDVNYTQVEVDYAGNLVLHACAAVRDANRILLVDPSYFWFGIPHKQFQVLSDDKELAYFLAFSKDDLECERAAALAPDWPNVRFWIAIAKANRGDFASAEHQLREGLKMDSSSWSSAYTSACVAHDKADWTASAVAARECVKKKPNWAWGWSLLAQASEHCGDLRSAAEGYQKFFDLAEDASDVAWARQGYWRVYNDPRWRYPQGH